MILVNLLLCQCLFSTAFLPTIFWNIQHFKCQYLKKYLALSRKFGIKMIRMCSRNRISLKKIRHFFTHQLENNWYVKWLIYSLKSIRYEPERANTPKNKEKCKIFVQKSLDYQGQNLPILFMDETNFNIIFLVQQASW